MKAQWWIPFVCGMLFGMFLTDVLWKGTHAPVHTDCGVPIDIVEKLLLMCAANPNCAELVHRNFRTPTPPSGP